MHVPCNHEVVFLKANIPQLHDLIKEYYACVGGRIYGSDTHVYLLQLSSIEPGFYHTVLIGLLW